jgi:hypothetical protein
MVFESKTGKGVCSFARLFYIPRQLTLSKEKAMDQFAFKISEHLRNFSVGHPRMGYNR